MVNPEVAVKLDRAAFAAQAAQTQVQQLQTEENDLQNWESAPALIQSDPCAACRRRGAFCEDCWKVRPHV